MIVTELNARDLGDPAMSSKRAGKCRGLTSVMFPSHRSMRGSYDLLSVR